jgi:aminoglycoside 3-N-acetyltransferase
MASDIVKKLIMELDLPQKCVIFLHVRLRNIRSLTGESYKDVTQAIIDLLLKYFEPKTILVPSYTFTFRRTGVFHRLFSRSETGRFSEEVRQNFAQYRTPDPVYSVLDVNGYLRNISAIDYTSIFGEHSLYKHLYDEGYIIVNIDTETFFATQIHWVEKRHQIHYRHERLYPGVIYYDESRWENIEYKAFLRDLKSDGMPYPAYNLKKRRQYLIQEGLLNTVAFNNIEVSWMPAHTFLQAFSKALSKDRRFLIH